MREKTVTISKAEAKGSGFAHVNPDGSNASVRPIPMHPDHHAAHKERVRLAAEQAGVEGTLVEVKVKDDPNLINYAVLAGEIKDPVESTDEPAVMEVTEKTTKVESPASVDTTPKTPEPSEGEPVASSEDPDVVGQEAAETSASPAVSTDSEDDTSGFDASDVDEDDEEDDTDPPGYTHQTGAVDPTV